MPTGLGDAAASMRPTIRGSRVTIRPGEPDDVPLLRAVLGEESVTRWWGEPESADVIAEKVRGDDSGVLLVVEFDGQVAGGIQYDEEQDPMYRHASIDIFLGTSFQGRAIGPEAIGLLAGFLFEHRGHHRIMIDPAAANDRAIRCYEKVGFRPVGVMRQYERGNDGHFHDGLLMDLLPDDLALRTGASGPVHDDLVRRMEARRHVERDKSGSAKERYQRHWRQLLQQALHQRMADARIAQLARNDHVFDISAQDAVGYRPGEADELVATPCAHRGSGRQNGGDLLCGAIGPPAFCSVQGKDCIGLDGSHAMRLDDDGGLFAHESRFSQ